MTTRARSGAGCFLLLWLTGWTVGCVALIGVVVNEPHIGTILFAIPFWASWLGVACFLVWCWFGSETLLVRGDRVLFLRKAIITLKTRAVPRNEVVKVHSAQSNHQENDEYLWGIEVVTAGQPIRFGFRLPDQERKWLVYQLNCFLNIDQGSATADSLLEQSEPWRESTSAPSTRLGLEDTADEPPSDTRWNCEVLVDGVEFSRSGKFSIAATAMLLFVNCFWNGIVSVFVLALFGLMPGDQGAPQGWEWWGLFVFLIPFEVIGLAMFAGLLANLAEPFRCTVWRLEHNELVRQIRWPLLSMTKRWNTADISHMELRRENENSGRKSRPIGRPGAGQQLEQLVFIRHDNSEQTSITGLSIGESRWIAGIMLEYERDWT